VIELVGYEDRRNPLISAVLAFATSLDGNVDESGLPPPV
jgi:hypothetical protein